MSQRAAAVSRRVWWRVRTEESGSAVVEFTLVVVVLLAMFLAIVQLGLALHVRNTLVASAAEGARYGANADRTPEDGASRARTLIASALSDRFPAVASAGRDDVDGVATVYVEVRAAVPVIGLWGTGGHFAVRGHAIAEYSP